MRLKFSVVFRQRKSVMFVHIIAAKYVDGYKLWLKFSDGIEGQIDLSSELHGKVFEPLKDIGYFKKFRIAGNTVTWANGADFAPEFLREHLV